MKTVLLLALLIVGNFAAQSEFAEFQSLEKNEFGKTLLDTIQVQLESKAPVDSLVKQLAYIENQLTDDQRKADQTHQAFQDKCDEEIKELEDDIARTTQKKNDLENEIDVKTEQLNLKRKRRADLQAQSKKIQGDINAAIAQRKKEAREFDTRVQEHQYASVVVNQAKRLFDKTFSQRSFLQTNAETTLNEIAKHFEQHSAESSFKHSSHYPSLFKIYSQICASSPLRSDKGMVGRVYRLFDETLAKIEDSLTNERRAEDKRISIYKKYRHALERQKAEVDREISSLNVQILGLENRLREAKQELSEAIRRINLKTQQLEDKQRECDDEAEAYKNDREKRDEKKNIVSTLIGLIQSKLRRLRAYSRKRR